MRKSDFSNRKTDEIFIVHIVHMTQLLLLGKFEYTGGPIFKVVKKGVLNLFLSIFMAYNVISCQKVAENTQILKIAKFAM